MFTLLISRYDYAEALSVQCLPCLVAAVHLDPAIYLCQSYDPF